MEAYSWDDKYLIGHDEIDRQHRHLFAILNNLYTGMKEHRSEEATAITLDELTQYALWHFEAEERVMLENNCPFLDAHSAVHRHFVKQVSALRQRGTAPHPFELLNFIGSWIVEHVGHEDVRIGRYLRQSGVTSPSSAG